MEERSDVACAVCTMPQMREFCVFLALNARNHRPFSVDEEYGMMMAQKDVDLGVYIIRVLSCFFIHLFLCLLIVIVCLRCAALMWRAQMIRMCC